MKCTTVLHGGVRHRTSTPHKSGNKIEEKKKADSVFARCGGSTSAPSIDPHYLNVATFCLISSPPSLTLLS